MRRHHGFTLLEMILTSAIAAMLMAGVLGLCTSMATSSRAMDQQATRSDLNQPWQQQAIALFQWDITQAREIQAQENQITLIGYGGIDPASFEATHRPVQVIYQILPASDSSSSAKKWGGEGEGGGGGGRRGGRASRSERTVNVPSNGWLVRQQTFLDVPAAEANPPSVQLVAGPVGRMTLHPLVTPTAKELTQADKQAAPRPIQWGEAKFRWSLIQKNQNVDRRSAADSAGSVRAIKIVVMPPILPDRQIAKASSTVAPLIDQIISLPSSSKEGARR